MTGGTGFIGSHLIDLMLAKDAEIFALVRDPLKARWKEGDKVHLLRGDLFSIPSLPSGIDIVFHLAGKTKAFKRADYYTVNQTGTARVFDALLAAAVSPKIVYLSSLAVCGPSQERRSIKESDPPKPITHYGRSKWLGEEEALKHKDRFSVIIARACAVYGPQDKDFLDYFRWIKRGILPTVRMEKWVSLIYVKDLVEALYLCSQKELPSGEVLNIGNPRPHTWEELGEAAGLALGRSLRKVRIPLGFFYLAAVLSELADRFRGKAGIFNRQKYLDLKQPAWVADVDKAAKLLDFEPRYGLAEGLRETMDWYSKNGWL